MTLPQLAETGLRVALRAIGPNAGLAAQPLAQHFDLTLTEAEAMLERGHGVIRVRSGTPGAVISVLATLGVEICTLAPDATPEAEAVDLSLRLSPGLDPVPVLCKLQGIGMAFGAGDFAGPSGLVLTGLAPARAEAIGRALRWLSGVQVTACPQNRARLDLFAPAGAPLPRPVARHLAMLGLKAGGPGAAIATGLDRATVRNVLSRFPEAGLMAVHQCFQRFDLILTGTGPLTRQELCDFLATRGANALPGMATVTGATLPQVPGLRIETGLTRAAASQFLADYATIGLSARAELIC